MVKRYLRTLLEQEGIDYEIKGNSFVIDCGGNDSDFIRMINIISNKMEDWCYHMELSLNIKIDTAYERIVIELCEDC